MARALLAERFSAHLDETGFLAGPGLALLAVSGGPDSVALLDLAAGVAAARGLALLVAHADHGIHPESAAIAGRVAELARVRYGLETVVAALELGADASEARARTARYEFLRRVQRERGARWLATAHHADDQAETVLLRVLRGSALAGLAGIPASGPDGLVRPLLPFRRAELAEHVAAAGLPTVDDPANRDPRHTRSWLRTEVMPLVERRVGPAAFDALSSVAAHAADDLAAWDAVLDALAPLEIRVAEGRADIARNALRGYDSRLAARAVRAAAHRAGLMLGPAQASRIVAFAAHAVSGRMLELGGGLVAEAAFDRLVIAPRPEVPEASPVEGDAGATQFGAFAVRWQREPAPERIARTGWTTWLEPGAVSLRRPERGARLVPLGGNGHRSVARLLMEGRIPRSGRATWPVVERDGAPVWIPGVCRGDSAVPAPGSLALRMDIAPAV